MGQEDPSYVGPPSLSVLGNHVKDVYLWYIKAHVRLAELLARPWLRVINTIKDAAYYPFASVVWPALYGTGLLIKDAASAGMTVASLPGKALGQVFPAYSRVPSPMDICTRVLQALIEGHRKSLEASTRIKLYLGSWGLYFNELGGRAFDFIDASLKSGWLLLYKPLAWTDKLGFDKKARLFALCLVVIPLTIKLIQAIFPVRYYVLIRSPVDGKVYSVPLTLPASRQVEQLIKNTEEMASRKEPVIPHVSVASVVSFLQKARNDPYLRRFIEAARFAHREGTPAEARFYLGRGFRMRWESFFLACLNDVHMSTESTHSRLRPVGQYTWARVAMSELRSAMPDLSKHCSFAANLYNDGIYTRPWKSLEHLALALHPNDFVLNSEHFATELSQGFHSRNVPRSQRPEDRLPTLGDLLCADPVLLPGLSHGSAIVHLSREPILEGVLADILSQPQGETAGALEEAKTLESLGLVSPRLPQLQPNGYRGRILATHLGASCSLSGPHAVTKLVSRQDLTDNRSSYSLFRWVDRLIGADGPRLYKASRSSQAVLDQCQAQWKPEPVSDANNGDPDSEALVEPKPSRLLLTQLPLVRGRFGPGPIELASDWFTKTITPLKTWYRYYVSHPLHLWARDRYRDLAAHFITNYPDDQSANGATAPIARSSAMSQTSNAQSHQTLTDMEPQLHSGSDQRDPSANASILSSDWEDASKVETKSRASELEAEIDTEFKMPVLERLPSSQEMHPLRTTAAAVKAIDDAVREVVTASEASLNDLLRSKHIAAPRSASEEEEEKRSSSVSSLAPTVVAEEFQSSAENESSRIEIVSVRPIGSSALEALFAAKRQQLLSQGNSNVRTLYFPASKSLLDEIVVSGFPRSSSPLIKDLRYGNGIYFYEKTSALVNALPADVNELRHVIVAEVIVGETCDVSGLQNITNDTCPQIKPSSDGITFPIVFYDSSNVPSLGLYVIFNAAQAVPRYVILFKLR